MARFALRPRSLALVALGGALVAACGPSLPAAAPRADASQLARCHVSASQDRPFVTEWPATERSRLEGKVASGLVVVSYTGCEMQILDRCRASGAYRFVPTSVATDGFSITTDDELYAKLPLGAASLEGELARSGKLDLRYAVVGQFEARDVDPARLALSGECGGATHVVTGYAVGAFALTTGSKDAVGGGVSVPTVGVGAKHARGEEVVRSSGGIDACKPSGASPPDGCRTPIQLFLAALPGRSAPPAGGVSGTAPGASAAPAIPDFRVVGYFAAGVAGGGELLKAAAPASAWIGPGGTGALGLRARIAEDLELQVRGLAGVEGHLRSGFNLPLIPLGLDATLRIRPRSWSYYVGGGGGGSLTITPGYDPYVRWHGLLETGFVFGATEAWDIGVRGGVGSTFTAELPALYNASLVFGRSFN
jgi:hypothetical protein